MSEKTFGQFIRDKRKLMGLTQEELAAKASAMMPDGMISGKQQISKWEKSRNTPSLERAVALSRALRVSLDELCSAFDSKEQERFLGQAAKDPIEALPADVLFDLKAMLSRPEGRALFDELLKLYKQGNEQLLPTMQSLLRIIFDRRG